MKSDEVKETKLKKIRLERNLFQNTVADAVGMSVLSLQYAEADSSNIQFDYLLKLANYYGVHYADLIDDEELANDAREIPLINEEYEND